MIFSSSFLFNFFLFIILCFFLFTSSLSGFRCFHSALLISLLSSSLLLAFCYLLFPPHVVRYFELSLRFQCSSIFLLCTSSGHRSLLPSLHMPTPLSCPGPVFLHTIRKPLRMPLRMPCPNTTPVPCCVVKKSAEPTKTAPKKRLSSGVHPSAVSVGTFVCQNTESIYS